MEQTNYNQRLYELLIAESSVDSDVDSIKNAENLSELVIKKTIDFLLERAQGKSSQEKMRAISAFKDLSRFTDVLDPLVTLLRKTDYQPDDCGEDEIYKAFIHDPRKAVIDVMGELKDLRFVPYLEECRHDYDRRWNSDFYLGFCKPYKHHVEKALKLINHGKGEKE